MSKRQVQEKCWRIYKSQELQWQSALEQVLHWHMGCGAGTSYSHPDLHSMC